MQLPPGILVFDADADGLISDDVRLVYAAVGSETPGLFVAPGSTQNRIVVGSSQPLAVGGVIYLQFPIAITVSPTDAITSYGEILFGDPRESDIAAGPELTFVTQDEFEVRASMDVVAFARILAPGPDTTTTNLGTQFPEEPTALVFSLPDLIFDGGVGTTSNTLPQFGDRQDGNDTHYRFFFSTAAGLEVVDDSNAIEVNTTDGARYVELEGGGRAVQLLTRDLAVGTYNLYVTSEVTGRIPLARSRGLLVRHEPSVLSLGPVDGPVTLDSGGLFDIDSLANGNGTRRLDVTFTALDHDDTVSVSLFYSSDAGLQARGLSVLGVERPLSVSDKK